MLGLIGWPDPGGNADGILALETRIAAVSASRAELGDPERSYNPVTLAGLLRLAPGFDWPAFLAGAGLAGAGRIIVDAPQSVAAIAAIAGRTRLDLLKARQAYATAELAAPWLGAEFRTEAEGFESRVQQGLQVGDRHVEAEKWLEACLPDALSELYVDAYGSAAVKAEAFRMAAAMRAALDRRLQRLSWMSAKGKAAARAKLAAMQLHIGYPDAFGGYSGLAIRDDDLYGNVRRAGEYAWRRNVGRPGRPVDRSDGG